jgi:hypothetical protein
MIELEPVFSGRSRAWAGGEGRGQVWRVTFDAEWIGLSDPPIQAQPCTVRLLAADGALLVERGFGLHVDRGGRDISSPIDFPVRTVPDPDRADVVCSRRG